MLVGSNWSPQAGGGGGGPVFRRLLDTCGHHENFSGFAKQHGKGC